MSNWQSQHESPGGAERPARLSFQIHKLGLWRCKKVPILGSAQELAAEYNFQQCAQPYRQKNPTPWHNPKYKLLSDRQLDLTVSFHVKHFITMKPRLCWPGANWQR